MFPKYSIILCTDVEYGIGSQTIDNNFFKMNWHIPEDLTYFKQVTMDNIIVMGKNTFLSMGAKALPRRTNVVISTSMTPGYDEVKNIYVFNNVRDFMVAYNNNNFDGAITPAAADTKVFVIGGSSLVETFIDKWPWLCQSVHLTKLESNFDCSIKMQQGFIDFIYAQNGQINDDNPRREYYYSSSLGIVYTRVIIDNVSLNVHPEEAQYRGLMRMILDKNGTGPLVTLRENRTNVKTISMFGTRVEFDMKGKYVIMLTSKKVFFKTVLVELLWFLSGRTDTASLKKYNCNIWNENTTREFLDSSGKSHLPADDIGEGYGWQWRNYGAKKVQGGQVDGVDQISEILKLLKTDPYSRRIILNSWNPGAIKDCALPPCHILGQFYARSKSIHNTSEGRSDQVFYLDCQLYQRSADIFLGVPFNYASYSILVHILCKLANACTHETGLIYLPGKLIHISGDAHIYENHLDAVNQYLDRNVYEEIPTLSISDNLKDINDLYDIEKGRFSIDLFTLNDYHCQSYIKAPMAV